jgi:UDP-sugar transporter A1/2/3
MLTVQNSAHALSMRYSRSELGERFLIKSAVVCAEVIKFVICCVIIARSESFQGMKQFTKLVKTSLPLAVPAGLYFVQNSLQYVGLENLDAATYSILSQLKLLTAAVFSVLMLGRKMSARKWRALCLLVIGVVLVQYHAPCKLDGEGGGGSHGAAAGGGGGASYITGLLAVGGIVTLSGFAGIYFEKVLKRKRAPTEAPAPKLTIWDRNFQLSLHGILFAILGLVVWDHEPLLAHGFFHGFSLFTWLPILIGALGGLLVGLVVAYASTII